MATPADAAPAAAASPAAPVATMRIYVHSVLNDAFRGWPEHTWVMHCAAGSSSPTVRRVKQLFKEELMRKHFSKDLIKLPIMSQGALRTTAGDSKTELKDEQLIGECVGDREDVFFELKGTLAPVKSSSSSSSASSSSSSSSSASSSGGAFDRNPNLPLGPAEQLIYSQLTFARELQTKGQLKKARDLYLQILAAVPADTSKTSAASEHAQSARQICHQQLGVIYLYNRQYENARPQLEAAVKIVTSGHSAASEAIVKGIGKTPQPDLAQLIALVGQCYYGLSDFSEAQTHFERALKLLTPKGEERSSDAALVATIKEVKVWLARAMYRGSPQERAQALSMFERLIAEDEHNIAALTFYAQIAIECGKKGEVIPYLLRALVASQAAGATNPKGSASYEANLLGRKEKPAGSELDPQLVELIQVLLTDLVSLPGGVKLLLDELHAASNNHAALTFLAQTVKDQGGVNAAIQIYKQALKVCDLDSKSKCSLLLNLVHTMELEYQYKEAFGLIKQYLKENASVCVGGAGSQAGGANLLAAMPSPGLSLGQFYKAIENIEDPYDIKLRTGDAPGVPAFCEIGKIFDEGVCHVTIPTPGSPPPKKSTAIPYPPDELQMIALMFTALKMLYVCGGLQVLPTLINMLEPLRVDRDLHLTLIRNEHAYASSIAQMMRYIPFPIPRELASAPQEDTIYVCGDSHSMSAAWQVIKLDAHPRPMLLVPKLVTGLKVWHMRPSCRFYPKRNYEAAIRSIPDGSSVIFNFGEIDCREGLIVAVEKGRYESVEAGVQLAVDVYVKAMQEQVAVKELKIYVHPITPVLDVTRPTVKLFESVLKARLAETLPKPGPKVKGAEPVYPLIYLDFFSALLTPDGNRFNMDYHLDSTHLKPTYVPALLRPALNKFWTPKGGKPGAAQSVAQMSTMDAINHRLKQASMGLGDEEESDPSDPHQMD